MLQFCSIDSTMQRKCCLVCYETEQNVLEYYCIGFTRDYFLFKPIIYRFKNHTFCEADYGFDLPKSLAVSDVAVCILHTHYDHVSPLRRILPLMQELSKIRSDLVLEVTEEEKEKEEGEQKSEKESDLANEDENYTPGRKVGKI